MHQPEQGAQPACAGQVVKSLPEEVGERQKAIAELLARIDTLVRALPMHVQAELSQLLLVLPARQAGMR